MWLKSRLPLLVSSLTLVGKQEAVFSCCGTERNTLEETCQWHGDDFEKEFLKDLGLGYERNTTSPITQPKPPM